MMSPARPRLPELAALFACTSAAACAGTDATASDPYVQEGPGFYQELSWSPDGSSLLVSVLEITDGDPGFAYRVWTLDPDEASARPITDGPSDYWTSWAPDGERVVFAGDGEGGALDLYTMRADGSDRVALVATEASETQPDWAPDGDRVVFVRYEGDRAQLWTVEADGSDERLLAGPAGEPQNPEWSPDGARIAFYETDPDGADRIIVAAADGSDPVAVAEGLWPTWAPDGQSIVYGGQGGLFRLVLPGGQPRLVVPGDVLAGEISPDGTRLAYIVETQDSVSIVVSDPDGTNARTVMTRPGPPW